DPATYYREMDIVPPDQMEALQQANLLITNYHAFILREKGDAARLTKQILTGGNGKGAFIETADEMVRRVCRDFGNKKNIVVLNDEAHHCYRRKPDAGDERLSLEERREATENARAAEVWISGLEAIKNKIGIKAVYDLSATPFFLRGSGYPEG